MFFFFGHEPFPFFTKQPWMMNYDQIHVDGVCLDDIATVILGGHDDLPTRTIASVALNVKIENIHSSLH